MLFASWPRKDLKPKEDRTLHRLILFKYVFHVQELPSFVDFQEKPDWRRALRALSWTRECATFRTWDKTLFHPNFEIIRIPHSARLIYVLHSDYLVEKETMLCVTYLVWSLYSEALWLSFSSMKMPLKNARSFIIRQSKTYRMSFILHIVRTKEIACSVTARGGVECGRERWHPRSLRSRRFR